MACPKVTPLDPDRPQSWSGLPSSGSGTTAEVVCEYTRPKIPSALRIATRFYHHLHRERERGLREKKVRVWRHLRRTLRFSSPRSSSPRREPCGRGWVQCSAVQWTRVRASGETTTRRKKERGDRGRPHLNGGRRQWRRRKGTEARKCPTVIHTYRRRSFPKTRDRSSSPPRRSPDERTCRPAFEKKKEVQVFGGMMAGILRFCHRTTSVVR